MAEITDIDLSSNETLVGVAYTDPSSARRAASKRFNLREGEFRIAKASEKAFRIVQIFPAEPADDDEALSPEADATIEDRVTHGDPAAYDAHLAEIEADQDAYTDRAWGEDGTPELDDDESTALDGLPEQPADDAQDPDPAPSGESLESAFVDDTAGFRPCLPGDVMGEDPADPEAEAGERERLERMACALDPRQEGIPWEGVQACERQAAVKIGLPDWYKAGRRFVLCLEGDSFSQSSPHCWAVEFSRRLGKAVVVRDAETFEALETYDHKAMHHSRKTEPRTTGGKESPKRGSRLDMIVRVLAPSNPKKPGTASHARFALWKDGRPLRESLDAGVFSADVSWDLSKGFVVLLDPADPMPA